jgi:hypothetical protein
MSSEREHEEAKQAYERSVKRADDADAVMRRVDDVVGMMRAERRENHWADKARAELRKRIA